MQRNAKKPPNGLEPLTCGLQNREQPSEVAEKKGLTEGVTSAGIQAGIEIQKTVHSDVSNDVHNTSDSNTKNDEFVEAMKMLSRLPLTDEERAEAVRRFLATKAG